MKFILTSIILLLTMCMQSVKKTKIIFFGDSITQMGVNKGGYINLIETALIDKKLQNKYDVQGAGIGGNKVYDLYLRLQEDVLDKKPTVVVIWVGVNDVWHKTTSGTGTDKDKFESFYKALIKKMQAKKIEVVLTTPAVIGEKRDGSNPQDKDLEAYSNVIRNLATQTNCKLVDLRKIFMDYYQGHNAENKEAGILTTDRVHLNDAGNQLVADEMTKILVRN